MKNIIHKIKFIALAVLALNVSSCDAVLDDEVTDYGTGPNFVGFSGTSLSLSAVTNGDEYQRTIPIEILGPSVPNINDEVTVNVAVESTSTAVEGVHYQLETTSVVLTPSESDGDRYVGGLPITILTDGLQAPLDETPVLNLTITEAATDANVVINDKTNEVAVNLAYSCPFNITDYEGTFIATTDEFGIYISEAQPFEVVAGPGENQITLVNFAAHPEEYDLIIDVDPSTGELTIPKQVALNYNNFGATQYGELSMEGEGTSGAASGSCIGEFSFSAAYTVGAGSFGNFVLGFERVE